MAKTTVGCDKQSIWCATAMKYVSWKDYKAITSGLKTVYQTSTEEAALMALDAFADIRDEKAPSSAKADVRTGKILIHFTGSKQPF